MDIRQAHHEDIDDIMAIYESARAFMREHGNETQWGDGYPSQSLIQSDIEDGACYVMEQGGRIAAVFCLLIGDDPTYRVITGGSWRSDAPYGAVHRIASDGTVRGVAQECFRFCEGRIPHLRVDTHMDNLAMQGAAEKYGFERRGIIHVEDGTLRVAFDYLGAPAEGNA